MAVAELIFDGKHGVGESPVWRADEASLYWVDIPAKAILCWNSRSGAVRAWSLPEMAGCIAHIDGPLGHAPIKAKGEADAVLGLNLAR